MKNHSKEAGTKDSSCTKREQYCLYAIILCTLLVGYSLILYVRGQFTLMKYLSYATGCLIGFLIIVAIIKIRYRSR